MVGDTFDHEDLDVNDSSLSADEETLRDEYRMGMRDYADNTSIDTKTEPTSPLIFEPVVFTSPHRICISYGHPRTRIDSFVKIEGGTGVHIGIGVHVASFCHLGIGGGELIIEDHAAFASGAKVITGSNQIKGLSCSAASLPEMQEIKRGRTTIGRFAFICTGAIVDMNVVIGEGAVLAAGARATRDIPAWEVWAGNPAVFVKRRQLADRFIL